MLLAAKKPIDKQYTEQSLTQKKLDLKKIFLNYCEFNKKTGAIFIS